MGQKKSVKKQWLAYSICGLLLIGSGLSLFGEAVILKYEESGFRVWFSTGTLALVVINAGISIFGHAVVLKVRLNEYRNHPISD
jgi:hypothetical protein